MQITAAEALALRMASLLLRPGSGSTRPEVTDVAGVVTWFGAMQAQELNSGLWSLGVRLPKLTLLDVQEALERREALRTWPMRGTVHWVPPRDARWMITVLGERALAGATARRAYLGLTEEVANRAVDVLGTALAGGGRLTRAQCVATLAEAGITGASQIGYHLLWYASQRGVTCIGPNVGTEQTFVLLDEWAPDPAEPDRDEALGIMALRYFRSHGPTTRQDFAGWLGSTAADAKLGIAVAGDALTTVEVDGTTMYLESARLDTLAADRAAPDRTATDGAHSADRAGLTSSALGGEIVALAGFDEYLLGFKDRSLMLDREHQQAIIPGGNGVFQWTIVRDGRVIGTWKRLPSKTRITVDVFPLIELTGPERAQVEAALQPFGRFTARPLRVRWPTLVS